MPNAEQELTELERAVAGACRKVSGHEKPIAPDSTVNLDLGIAGDDGDELAGEIISSTGLAIDPDLDFGSYFGGEGSIVLALLFVFKWKGWRQVQPLSVRQLASSLRDDRALAQKQIDSLNAFWRRNWTLPDQGSSSTSQYR